MRKLLLAALVAGTFATPVLAQEGRAPFTGARVGGLVGYDAIQPGSSEDSDIDGDDQTADGVLYGVDVGYDFNLGSAVIGVEGEFTESSGKVETDTSRRFRGVMALASVSAGASEGRGGGRWSAAPFFVVTLACPCLAMRYHWRAMRGWGAAPD